jgi:HTH-type transcriptional regulator / antitoxin HigA
MSKEWIRHPGVYIKEELEARNWNQRDLAFILNCPEQSLTLLLTGKKGVSLDMAKALGNAFNVNPQFFMNLQHAFDLEHAPEPNPGVAKRAAIQLAYPVREMIKRDWIKTGDAAFLEAQVAKHFMVDDIRKTPHMMDQMAAKRTRYDEVPPEQLAWLFRVRHIAKVLPVPEYSETALRGILPKLKQFLKDPEEIKNVPRLLMECGVRFILVEPLPSSKIDGVCFWLNEKSPVIGMSLRYDRIDNYWFVLRHEIEHVLNKHGMGDGNEIIDVDIMAQQVNIAEEERIANRAAADFCVPIEKMDNFLNRKGAYVSRIDIAGFARLLNVHPGIVVGQFHNRTGRYQLFKPYQVKIRHFAVSGAIVDGWGQVFPVTL